MFSSWLQHSEVCVDPTNPRATSPWWQVLLVMWLLLCSSLAMVVLAVPSPCLFEPTWLGVHLPLQPLCIKLLCLLTDLPEANASFNEVFQITPSHGGCNNTDHCPLASKNSVLLTLFCAFWSSS